MAKANFQNKKGAKGKSPDKTKSRNNGLKVKKYETFTQILQQSNKNEGDKSTIGKAKYKALVNQVKTGNPAIKNILTKGSQRG